MVNLLDRFAFCPVCGNGKSQRHESGCEMVTVTRNAQLYDKLKALIQRKGFDVGDGDLENIAIAEDFDGAVKALPDA